MFRDQIGRVRDIGTGSCQKLGGIDQRLPYTQGFEARPVLRQFERRYSKVVIRDATVVFPFVDSIHEKQSLLGMIVVFGPAERTRCSWHLLLRMERDACHMSISTRSINGGDAEERKDLRLENAFHKTDEHTQ